MADLVHELLSPWESFYVIVGSSAAGLTGLQFVVITMVTELRRRANATQTAAFSTPTVIHFTATLVISAILSAPWHTMTWPVALLATIGVAGLGYAARVLRNVRRQHGYRLVAEDWALHIVLPCAAYAGLFASALMLRRMPVDALFGLAGVTVLLLLIGIHNAWDAVTYVSARPDAIGGSDDTDDTPEASSPD